MGAERMGQGDSEAWRLTDDVVTPISQGREKKAGGNRTSSTGRPRRGDAWDLSSGGYDVDRFYTATVIGEKSESEKVSIRVDVNTWGRLQSLIGSGKIPSYQNSHDFIRDAIVHRLHHLSLGINDPVLDEWVKILVRQGNMDMKNRIIQSAKDLVTSHQNSFQMALENEDWIIAREMIEGAREAVDELREPYASNLSKATDDFERRVDGVMGKGGQVRVRGK